MCSRFSITVLPKFDISIQFQTFNIQQKFDICQKHNNDWMSNLSCYYGLTFTKNESENVSSNDYVRKEYYRNS